MPSKIASIFLSVSLVFSGIVYAAPAARETAIPPRLAAIEESFEGPSGKTVTFIQDAHNSMEAQKNIARLVRHFVENEDVKTVYEEGYQGEVPSDRYFGQIKDEQLKRKISWKLMERMRLGGAEYAHINRKKDFRLIGADNVLLLLQNVRAYQKTARRQKETAEDLANLSREITRLADGYFPGPLKEWMKLKKRFDESSIDMLDYCRRVLALKGGGSSSYPNLSLLVNFEETKDPAVIDRLNAIDAREVFREIDRLEEDLAKTYLENERDEKIFHYHKYIELVKRLNSIRLTAPEYEGVGAQVRSLNTRSMAEFIYSERRKPLVLSKQWEDNIRDAIRFYRIAKMRDDAIEVEMEKFLANPDEKHAVLVYGGFHKDRIREILRRKGLSARILMPVITHAEAKYEKLYEGLMSKGYQPLGVSILARASRYPPIYVDAIVSGGDTVRNLIMQIAGTPARSEVRAAKVKARREMLKGILDNAAEPMTRAEVWEEAKKKEAYRDITLRDIYADFQTVDALKKHARLKRDTPGPATRADAPTQIRRDLLVRLLDEAEEKLTSTKLWEKIRTQEGYAATELQTVRNDIQSDERISGHKNFEKIFVGRPKGSKNRAKAETGPRYESLDGAALTAGAADRRIDVRALAASAKNIPAVLFFRYEDIRENSSALRRGLIALAAQSRGSQLKLIIYEAEMTDLGLEELRGLGVVTSTQVFKDAYGQYGDKRNHRNVNVSPNADVLRRQLGEISRFDINHVLTVEESDIWAAYVRAIIDPAQTIPGLDNSEGFYRVTAEFMRSELRKYQASLVILASA